MRINFLGRLVDEPEIRAGFIGAGSHSFRNVYPTFQFAPVNLAAVCDLDVERAQAFARKFGAEKAYGDYREMLEREKLDAVFIVTGYDAEGRPLYPSMATDCLEAGCHVWMEKPPAATSAELKQLQALSERTGKQVLVGMKKMFAPANEKAKSLSERPEFGGIALAQLQYPQYIPTVDELTRYLHGRERVGPAISFLDHLCHPMALLVLLLGMPKTMTYERSDKGSGVALFTYDSGAVSTLVLTHGAAGLDGMERTTIVGRNGRHITVENNMEVRYHRIPRLGYGDVPDFYITEPDETTAIWRPEVSLGQLYNKGLFMLGYYNEVNEFARAILEGRSVAKGTLEQAWQVTRVFEAFIEGPGKKIELS